MTGTKGISSFLLAIPKFIVGLIGIKTGALDAAAGLGTMDAVMKAMNINPVMLAISAIVALGAASYFALDAAITTTEEYKEKLGNLSQEYGDITSKISELNSELTKTQDRITELENKDSLTLIKKCQTIFIS